MQKPILISLAVIFTMSCQQPNSEAIEETIQSQQNIENDNQTESQVMDEAKNSKKAYDGWLELKKFNEPGAANYFSITNKDKEYIFDIIVPLTSYFEKDKEGNSNILGYVYKQDDTDFYYQSNQNTILGVQVSVPSSQYKEVIQNSFSVEGISDEIKSLYGIEENAYITFYDTKENKYIDAQEIANNLRLKGNSIFVMKNLLSLVGLNDGNWEQNEIDLFTKELSSYNFRKANYNDEFKDGLSSGRYQIQLVKTANKYYDKNNAPIRMLQVSGTLLQAEKMTQNYYQITLRNGKVESNTELNQHTKANLKTVKLGANDFDKLARGEMLQNSESIDLNKPKEEVISKQEEIKYYQINDPDGYTNLRKNPSGDIIRKVYKDERFSVLQIEDKHAKVKFENGDLGYIHESRVKPI